MPQLAITISGTTTTGKDVVELVDGLAETDGLIKVVEIQQCFGAGTEILGMSWVSSELSEFPHQA